MRRNVSAKEESSLMRPFWDKMPDKSTNPLPNSRHWYTGSNCNFSNSVSPIIGVPFVSVKDLVFLPMHI